MQTLFCGKKDVIAKALSQPFSTFQPFLSSFSLIYFEVIGFKLFTIKSSTLKA
jgi:hypothetical protein